MRLTSIILCYFSLLLSVFASGDTKKIVFIAGEDSHGYGEHEFRAGCHLLANCLNKSGLKIEAKVIENGWPQNENVLKDANAIIIFSNGRDQHPLKSHFESLDKLVEKGVGVGFLHDACNVIPGKDSAFMDKWIGGHYEKGFSTNPKWECKAEIDRKLPVSRGVRPFKLFDEWHFNIKFPEVNQVHGAITGVPDEAARSGATSNPRGPFKHIVDAAGKKELLFWTKDSGKFRGFGFTGGHYHNNWENKNLRTLMLNSIVWLTGLEVPVDGVPSKKPTKVEMAHRMSPSPEEVIWSTEIKNTHKAQLKYKSPVIKGNNKAIEKTIDLDGARELILMVLDGGNGINKDHCAWGNPQLIFNDGSTKALTELTWEVGITGWREIKIDQGVENIKMIIDNKEVKGISTHALSIIRYKLPENVKSFKVLMGLLDSSRGSGSVQFEVYAK